MVCIASLTTTIFLSKSSLIFSIFISILFNPFIIFLKAIVICPNATPTLRNTVESVKSRCNLEIGNFCDKNVKIEFAINKLPSAFSN